MSMLYLKQFRELFLSAVKTFYKEGVISLVKKAAEYLLPRKYKYSPPCYSAEVNIKIQNLEYKPFFTIIILLEDIKNLTKIITSIKNQWYKHYEIILIEDLVNSNYNYNTLNNELNIKSITLEPAFDLKRRILKEANGEFILFMNSECLLSPDLLYKITLRLNKSKSQVLYFDEDVVDTKGNHNLPFFKPDYSYHLLLSFNYFGICFCVDKHLFNKIDCLGDYNGYNLLYDISLQCIENTKRIDHIPEVLFHNLQQRKLNTDSKSVEVVNDHLKRKRILAKVEFDNSLGCNDVIYSLPEPKPFISLIILTKDKLNYLRRFIKSIITKSTYPNYEIIIVDNRSEKKETIEWLNKAQKLYDNLKVVKADFQFNWSKLNNKGIKASQGDVLIFLNNDMEVISNDWMERMAGDALQPEVGTVGALLLYKDYTIQHAGAVVGLIGWCNHLYRFSKVNKKKHRPFVSPLYKRNILASTGACLCVSRKVIEDIGMFDERYCITDGDIEFSLRAFDRGYINVYNPYVRLFHYEGKSRSNNVLQTDLDYAKKVYIKYLENGDPYYNKNLSLYTPEPKIKLFSLKR